MKENAFDLSISWKKWHNFILKFESIDAELTFDVKLSSKLFLT